MTLPCPCGLNASYSDCCGRYIDIGVPAPDPESLMRSRYSAFVLGNADYLVKTWHPKTRPALDPGELAGTHWLKLVVLRSQKGHKQGLVEFTAWYEDQGDSRPMHEISRFRKIKNRWFYEGPISDWPGETKSKPA